MAATLPLRQALTESISSGRLEDTKIILYSRRDSSGTVYRPRALYASSHVLKTVPYFNDRRPLSTSLTDRAANDALRVLFGTFAEAESKNFSEAIDDTESVEDYGYYSDSDLEEDDDHIVNLAIQPKETIPLRGHPFDPFCFSLGDDKSTHTHGERKEHPEEGKVIKIQDVAFVTFQAFLFYLYTSQIEFAPHGSERNRRSRTAEILSVSKDSIPRPSPKSIYRLADKYDIPSLKELALDSIKDGLKSCDIVEEVFSEFASKYQEVRTVQVKHLASVWFRGDEESAEGLGEKIDEKIESYANGQLDYAMEAMTLLWELSRGHEDPLEDLPQRIPSPVTLSDINTPVCPFPVVSFATDTPYPPQESQNWRRFKTALVKSIHEGTFFDRKYWTRRSKTAKVLRPVYISSIVVGERLRYVDSVVKPHQEEESFDTASGSEDSDCESSSEQASESPPEEQVDRKEETEQQTLPVLTVGSFASWRSLFFYLCTDVIQFAPLKSQGTDVRAQYVREQTTPDRPPPCSPRVIYSLASALDIKPLRDLAFDDIRSKVTSTNVVTELFSSFTSRESDVMKMHCKLLSGKFHERNTTSSVADLIKSMAGGSAVHRAGALKLALRNGRSKGGALLRCPYHHCDFHHNPISYRSMGPSLECPRDHWEGNPLMECTNCGQVRSNSHTECQRCGEWFK
ncbi:hypothetical protein BDM02DRAFT_3262815 [Thelephora ganbajun]|uniref:Uncharacterized protein n=1 Tax=Thelephora ganbajun TaxID=370292 RepID=A0ACB6Z7C1_THEGA|nr:hypothetical protein BDM02DRAFT_3262815 [Thelephora ganbajun]